MSKKMLIDATHAEETRVVVVDGNKVEEFDFETVNRRQLAGNIYLAKVTRVEPSLQAAFVDYGGNRHGFLAFSEIHPDYYQIPVADREALLAEERAFAVQDADDEPEKKPRKRRSSAKAADAKSSDAVEKREVAEPSSGQISGMDVVDLGDEDDEDPANAPVEVAEDVGAGSAVATKSSDDSAADETSTETGEGDAAESTEQAAEQEPEAPVAEDGAVDEVAEEAEPA
ncbi:MAG: ribonuclease E/G, partial [Pseudomonadota bacterium]